jgi:indole-3-glycerol phosphate synthase
MVPKDRILVTESGILGSADVQLMRNNQINAFLYMHYSVLDYISGGFLQWH